MWKTGDYLNERYKNSLKCIAIVSELFQAIHFSLFLVSVVEKKNIAKRKQKIENSVFICEICGKIFSRLYNLQRHENNFGHKQHEGKRDILL